MSRKKFFNHPLKEYHATFLRDYRKTIKTLELTPEFHSKNLSQISFHILYNCEFSDWSEELKKEVQKVKEFYLDKGVFAKVLHDPEDRREYIDVGDTHIKHYFSVINERMLEDSHIDNISKSFDESKIYQINKREYEHVYYNLYYDNFTNEEEYYGCDKSIYERLEYNVEEAEYVDVSWKDSKTLYVPFMEMNDYFEMIEENDDSDDKSSAFTFSLNPFHFTGAYVLSGKEIKEIIEEIKSLSTINRVKTYSISVIEEDVKRYYRFVDVDDEGNYYNKEDLENLYAMGTFINKDNSDPGIREKARNFAKICFAYRMFNFNHNYLVNILDYQEHSHPNRKSPHFESIIATIKNSYSGTKNYHDDYEIAEYIHKNKDISFLNFTIDKNHRFCQMHKKFVESLECWEMGETRKKRYERNDGKVIKFRSKPCEYEKDEFGFDVNHPYPRIYIKVIQNKLTQEELSLLDEFPVQAAFIYKNYPYLQNTQFSKKNLDPFFNMLKIIKLTQCNLDINDF